MKFGKDYKEVASRILGCTLASYYNWDKQDRPIISLLEKYFSKENLQEFLDTGKISKFDNAERLLEILKFLSKYTTKELRVSLAKSFEKNDVLSGTYARLIKYSQYSKEDKFDILKDIDYLLFDVYDEKQKQEVDTPFQDILKGFNSSIGFDFNEDDILVIKQIMQRYEVYNTLYDLDKPTQK